MAHLLTCRAEISLLCVSAPKIIFEASRLPIVIYYQIFCIIRSNLDGDIFYTIFYNKIFAFFYNKIFAFFYNKIFAFFYTKIFGFYTNFVVDQFSLHQKFCFFFTPIFSYTKNFAFFTPFFFNFFTTNFES